MQKLINWYTKWTQTVVIIFWFLSSFFLVFIFVLDSVRDSEFFEQLEDFVLKGLEFDDVTDAEHVVSFDVVQVRLVEAFEDFFGFLVGTNWGDDDDFEAVHSVVLVELVLFCFVVSEHGPFWRINLVDQGIDGLGDADKILDTMWLLELLVIRFWDVQRIKIKDDLFVLKDEQFVDFVLHFVFVDLCLLINCEKDYEWMRFLGVSI